MAGGANPTAANDGGSGDGVILGFWDIYSTSLVPALYGLYALLGWVLSPTVPGGEIALVSGVLLIAIAIAVLALRLQIGNRQDYFTGLGLIALVLPLLWWSRYFPNIPDLPGFVTVLEVVGLIVATGFWRTYSASVVPALYGLFALWAWFRSPTAPGIGEIELASGVVLLAVAIAIIAMRLPIGSKQDYFGGLGLVALALFALWASRDLPGMRGFAFGPGTAPRMFAIMLGLIGLAVTIVGFLTKGPPIDRFGVRGPVLILASAFVFALCIRPLGLVVASFISIIVSAGATTEVRWVETVIWSAVLTLFCALLFPWGLNLPLPMWPTIDLLHIFGLR